MTSFWTDEQKGWLREVAREETSCAQIAAAFGRRFGEPRSRNAIAGALRRLGIPDPRARGANAQVREKVVREQRAKNRAQPFMASFKRANDPAPRPIPEIVAVDIPKPPVVAQTLMEATGCRWIDGDPGERAPFSCAQPQQDSPYCAYHSAIAFNGPASRARDVRKLMKIGVAS